jgi:hypothetical protein
MNAGSARLVVLALSLAAATAAFAQGSGHAAATACPKAQEATHRNLLGTWQAEVEGQPAAVIVLRQHPDLAESVRGSVRRAGRDTEAAGDVDEGEFTLEESADGIHISAVWLGDVAPGSCAREIRGTWQADGERATHQFVLRKQ